MQTRDLAIIAAATVAGAYMVGLWMLRGQPVDEATQDDQTQDQPDTTDTTTAADIIDMVTAPVKSALGLWRPPAQYAGLIADAEQRHGIPTDMLARLLYQESHYRQDIISGAKTSPVGAQGIAQFMPATAQELGIDPLNVPQAIDAAGRYLARLYRALGNWSEALAAYNWGIGNVSRKGLAKAPAETRNYFTNILADVNAANGTNYA